MFWILFLTWASLLSASDNEQQLKPHIPSIMFEAEKKEFQTQLQLIASFLSLFVHVSSQPQCAQVVGVDKRRREIGGVLENWVSRDVSGLVLDYEDSFADEPWVRFVKDVFEPYAQVPMGGILTPTQFLSWLREKHPKMYSKPNTKDMSDLLFSSMKKMYGHTPFCYTLLEEFTGGRLGEESSNESVHINHFDATLSLEKVLGNSETFTRMTSSLKFSKLPKLLTFSRVTQVVPEFLNVSSQCTPTLQQGTESTVYQLLGCLYQNKPVVGTSYGTVVVACPYTLLLRKKNDWFYDLEPGKFEPIPQNEVDQVLPRAFWGQAHLVYEHVKTK